MRPKAADGSAAGAGLAAADARLRLRRFNEALLAAPSATRALEAWLAGAGPLRARVALGAERAPTASQRARLGVGPDVPIAYRRVELACAGRILSEAENWYVPSRLTAAMRATLAASETPFGRAVSGLRPRRDTFLVDVLWPGGQDQAEGAEACAAIPWRVLEHRALVLDAAGRPVSEVHEFYTREVLGFGAP